MLDRNRAVGHTKPTMHIIENRVLDTGDTGRSPHASLPAEPVIPPTATPEVLSSPLSLPEVPVVQLVWVEIRNRRRGVNGVAPNFLPPLLR